MIRNLLSALMLTLLPALAWSQVSQPPAAGDGGRRTMGVMGTYKTPQEYGARGDAKRRPAMIRTVNASPALESYGTYSLINVRVQCTIGVSTVTLTPGIIPTPVTTTNNTRGIALPCGAAGAVQFTNVTSITAPGATQTITMAANAISTQDNSAATMQITPQSYSPGAATTSAARGTYGEAAYTTMSFTAGTATLTLPSGTLAPWDITTPGYTGAYNTEVAIPNGAGAGCDQYFYTRILSFTVGDTATLEAAPTCSQTNQVALIYWGNLIFRSTDVGKSIEIIDGLGAVGSDSNMVSTIATVVDPFNITTAANFGATRTITMTELTYGTNDTTAVFNMAKAAYNAGYRRVYWPKDFNTFLPTATFGTGDNFINSWLATVVACGEGNYYMPRSLKYTKTLQRDCVNPIPTPPPSNDINPRISLRQLSSKSPTSTSTVVFVGDSQMTAQAHILTASGMSDMLCNSVQKKNPGRTINCVNYAIGGTQIFQFDPTGPNSGNGAGIPSGSTSLFPGWYTNVANTWMSYVQGKCPDTVFIKFGINDQTNFSWASMINVHNYLQGSTWKAACGTNPDEMWVTDAPHGEQSTTNSFTSAATEYNMMLQRGWALSCEYKLANGGCPGLVDIQRARQYGYYGWGSEELTPQRALYVSPPQSPNTLSRSTSPYIWPVPTYDYGINLNGIRVTGATPAAFWASLTSIDFTLGPGSIGTPVSNGTQTGLAQGYDGSKIRISYNGSNFTTQVFTFDVTNTATVTNTGGGSTITCSAACTNMGFVNATVDLPGAGAAGATYTGTVTAINSAGTVLTVTPTLTTALTAQSKALRLYHTTGVSDTGVTAICTVVSTFCETGFNVVISGSNYNIYNQQCFTCPPIASGRVAKFGGYFRPQVTLNGTFATYRLSADSNSDLTTSSDGRPDNGTMFIIPTSDMDNFGQRNPYTGLFGGGGSVHAHPASDTWFVQAYLDQQHFQTDVDVTTGGASTPINGFTLTPVAGQKFTAITPAGTLATGTFNIPTGIPQNERVTLYSSQIVTALTVAAPTGYTINGAAVTTIAANGTLSYILNGTVFYRVQ